MESGAHSDIQSLSCSRHHLQMKGGCVREWLLWPRRSNGSQSPPVQKHPQTPCQRIKEPYHTWYYNSQIQNTLLKIQFCQLRNVLHLNHVKIENRFLNCKNISEYNCIYDSSENINSARVHIRGKQILKTLKKTYRLQTF